MTLQEIDSTLQALNLDTTHLALQLPADDLVKNFPNNSDRLWVSPAFATQYETMIQGLAPAAAANAQIVGCTTQDDACATQFINTFVRKAWRRPLGPDEVADLMGLYTTGKTGGTFTDGIELVLEAVLQAPEFLYHSELGPDGANDSAQLTSHELAEELAYAATGSLPDDELLALADGDTLSDPDVREAQVRRLLLKGGREQMSRFVFSWLGITRLDHAEKAADVYPKFNDAIRTAMKAETKAFIGAALFDDDGTLNALLNGKYTFVDANLAAYYGIQAPGAQAGVFAKVSVDSTQRAGILTQGSLLSAYAQQDESAPVRRGHMVRSQFLCQDLPPPPPTLKITNPAVDTTHTTRDRFKAHSQDPVCWNCHSLMDPIGFGFENFDGVGEWRTTENNLPVDASGSVTGTKDVDGDFVGVPQLAAKLAQSETVRACVATNVFRFSIGRVETESDSCLLQNVTQAYTADKPITELLIAYVRSNEFLVRKVESGQ